MTGQELEALTYRYLPEDFFRRALQATFMAHDVSWKETLSGFALPEARNLQPFDKRARMESYLRDVAELFEGVTAEVVKEPDSNWWYHTEIHAGPIVLTANSVPHPCALADKAEFRKTLARNNQGTLWDEPLSEDPPLYILLLHSKSRWNTQEDERKYRHLPRSAHIAYPSADMSGYLHEIDLFDRFQDVVESFMPQEWDSEAKARYIRGAKKVMEA